MALLCTASPRQEVQTHGKTYYVATGPRSLPQGAPASPSHTNALCLRLDARLSALGVNTPPVGRPFAGVPRTTVRNLRAAIKNRELGKPGKGETLEHLKGLCAFVMMTDRARGSELMARVDRLIAARGGS